MQNGQMHDKIIRTVGVRNEKKLHIITIYFD